MFIRSIKLIALSVLVASVPILAIAQSSDIELIPPADGGFSVISGATNEHQFRVNEAGEVFIYDLPSELSGVPLCWNASTGRLGVCAGSAGVNDMTPPVIETNAPESAESSSVSFATTYTDDTELAFRWNAESGYRAFDPGVKSEVVETTVSVPLGGAFDVMLVANDMAGNVTKKLISISTPETGFKLGAYQVSSGGVLPNDFDCSLFNRGFGEEYLSGGGGRNGEIISAIDLIAGTSGDEPRDWSVSDGYYLQIVGDIWGSFLERISFSQNSASLRNRTSAGTFSGGGGYSLSYIVDLESFGGNPSNIQLSIQMECQIISGSSSETETRVGEKASMLLQYKN